MEQVGKGTAAFAAGDSGKQVVSHTPGPWEWDWYDLRGAGGAYVIEFEQMSCGGGGDYPVCSSASLHVGDADAALISAAPDLLSALEGLCGLAEMRGGNLHEYKAAIEAARAAIARATAR